MLIFSNLGKKGNFGNHMFQIASTIGIATKNGHDFAFPKWKYATYFNFDFPIYDSKIKYQLLKKNSVILMIIIKHLACAIQQWVWQF